MLGTLESILLLIAIIFMGLKIYSNRHPIRIRLSRRGQQVVGKVCTLETPVVNGLGMVHIKKKTWRVHCVDLPAGSRIRITHHDERGLFAEPNKQ